MSDSAQPVAESRAGAVLSVATVQAHFDLLAELVGDGVPSRREWELAVRFVQRLRDGAVCPIRQDNLDGQKVRHEQRKEIEALKYELAHRKTIEEARRHPSVESIAPYTLSTPNELVSLAYERQAAQLRADLPLSPALRREIMGERAAAVLVGAPPPRRSAFIDPARLQAMADGKITESEQL